MQKEILWSDNRNVRNLPGACKLYQQISKLQNHTFSAKISRKGLSRGERGSWVNNNITNCETSAISVVKSQLQIEKSNLDLFGGQSAVAIEIIDVGRVLLLQLLFVVNLHSHQHFHLLKSLIHLLHYSTKLSLTVNGRVRVYYAFP